MGSTLSLIAAQLQALRFGSEARDGVRGPVFLINADVPANAISHNFLIMN